MAQASANIDDEVLDLRRRFVRDRQQDLLLAGMAVSLPTALSSLGRLVMASRRVLG